MSLYHPFRSLITRNNAASLHSRRKLIQLTSGAHNISMGKHEYSLYSLPGRFYASNGQLALPTSKARWHLGNYMSLPWSRGISHPVPHSVCPPSHVPRKPTRENLELKRLTSCGSVSRAELGTIQNVDSIDNAQQGELTGPDVPKKPHLLESYSSQDENFSTSQQAVPSRQLENKPAQQFWSHRLYKNRDGKDITVHYCQSLKTTEKVAQYFQNDTILGFDMEWDTFASKKARVQDNVSLIQLANEDRIALFQISRFVPGKTLKDLVSPALKSILENENITKVGVNIKSDCTRLRKNLEIDARGIFELSHLYKLVKYCHTKPGMINKYLVSLHVQVEEHFGLPLAKEDEVRCSNWTSPLTYRQVQYAAADAYAGYKLFHTLDAKRKALDPVPPLPALAELNLPIRTVMEKKTVDLVSKGTKDVVGPVDTAEKPGDHSQSA